MSRLLINIVNRLYKIFKRNLLCKVLTFMFLAWGYVYLCWSGYKICMHDYYVTQTIIFQGDTFLDFAKDYYKMHERYPDQNTLKIPKGWIYTKHSNNSFKLVNNPYYYFKPKKTSLLFLMNVKKYQNGWYILHPGEKMVRIAEYDRGQTP